MENGGEPNGSAGEQSLATATHLVVLVHGLHGSDQDFANFQKLLVEHFAKESVYVHSATSNAATFFQTYDGIDTGGERLAQEIQDLASQMPQLARFSVLGHSLGGLYSRYAIGILFARGFFVDVEPMTLSMNSFVARSTEHFQAPVRSDMEGTLLICLEGACGDGELFEYYHCVLEDQLLQLFEIENQSGADFSIADQKSVVDIDLTRAEVTLELPHRPQRPKSGSGRVHSIYSSLLSLTRRSSTSSRRGSNASHTSDASRFSDPDIESSSHDPYEILIKYTPNSYDSVTDIGKRRVCVIRIPSEEIDRDWKWLVALSNNSFGLRCQAKSKRKDSSVRDENEAIEAPPLLTCMARGQFLQALLMFKARTLYANVFFDLQVPYSCGSIRAFNPYRMETTKRSTSPVYPHVTLYSIGSAPLVRDTLTAEIKLQLASKHGPVRFFSQDGHRKRLSFSAGGNSLPADFESDMSSHRYTATDETEHSRRASASSSASFSADGTRSDPFVDGDLIVDRVHEAFTSSSDTERDALRGMLLTLQSVGWRRIDVLFDNVLAHERIIAKRANPNKLHESGIDVVYHVMNSFLL
ncbi:putative alpha/beta hydrolase, partial [Globisporangium splendens]